MYVYIAFLNLWDWIYLLSQQINKGCKKERVTNFKHLKQPNLTHLVSIFLRMKFKTQNDFLVVRTITMKSTPWTHEHIIQDKPWIHKYIMIIKYESKLENTSWIHHDEYMNPYFTDEL